MSNEIESLPAIPPEFANMPSVWVNCFIVRDDSETFRIIFADNSGSVVAARCSLVMSDETAMSLATLIKKTVEERQRVSEAQRAARRLS